MYDPFNSITREVTNVLYGNGKGPVAVHPLIELVIEYHGVWEGVVTSRALYESSPGVWGMCRVNASRTPNDGGDQIVVVSEKGISRSILVISLSTGLVHMHACMPACSVILY